VSFEGYYQALCENGHDCSSDVYEFVEQGPCHVCGGKIVWRNLVDQTNDSGEEDIVPLEPKTYKTIEVVDTYWIPKCNARGRFRRNNKTQESKDE